MAKWETRAGLADPQWQELCHRLRRCAAGLAARPEDADDLVQQTLTHLLARRPEMVAHVGYARRTMLRLWLDQQRSLRRRLARVARLATGPPVARPAADRLADRELGQRLRAEIAKLPPRQRAVLVLRLVEELSYDDIASTLGISRDNVRASLHLARRRVREALGAIA